MTILNRYNKSYLEISSYFDTIYQLYNKCNENNANGLNIIRLF